MRTASPRPLVVLLFKDTISPPRLAFTAAFEQYVESMLAPHLSAGQIVVMDNLRCHKSEKVRLAIEARGCHLLSLLTITAADARGWFRHCGYVPVGERSDG